MKLSISSPKNCSLSDAVIRYVEDKGIQIIQMGALTGKKSDYISAAQELSETICAGTCELGILFCHTGTGATIIANKYPGIRAALCPDSFSAKIAREANNANVLILGIRLTGEALAFEIIDTWLECRPSKKPAWVEFHKRTDAIDELYRKI